MSVNVTTVVQARVGSTRLPDKVTRLVWGRPLLAMQLDRMSTASHVGTIVVALPDGNQDDRLAAELSSSGHHVYRGPSEDLVERHLGAAERTHADVVVKVPSDCPLIDPAVIDEVIGHFHDGCFEYVSNLHPASWPDGQDVEVMSIEALRVVAQEADRPFEREHTTPYIWERPGRFRIGNVTSPANRFADVRLTVDYEEDLELIRAVVAAVGFDASIEEIIDFLDANPEVAILNAHLRGVNWYRHHLDELTSVDASETRLGPGERP